MMKETEVKTSRDLSWQMGYLIGVRKNLEGMGVEVRQGYQSYLLPAQLTREQAIYLTDDAIVRTWSDIRKTGDKKLMEVTREKLADLREYCDRIREVGEI